MPVLDKIETIVILMFENRSFDHLLGHLSLEDPASTVEGLRNPDTNPSYANLHDNMVYRPWRIQDQDLIHDLPHKRSAVNTQMASKGGKFRMSGFTKAYVEKTFHAVPQSPPLGYFDSTSVWMSSFLAKNYGVCDHWFTPVPADTQPNRSMAFTGMTLVDDTQVRGIPNREHVFRWLEQRSLRWRVYYDGPPFFLLFSGLDDLVMGPAFRPIGDLERDMDNEPLHQMPQVIFIEPRYFDWPWSDRPANDNHPIARICDGEQYLHRVYSALTRKPEKWDRTLFIVTYDEHGGFFDHVPPLPIVSPRPKKAKYKNPAAFLTTGPRVPAIIASPWVQPGTVFKGHLDHTSMLQLLAEKFEGDPTRYSTSVNERRKQGIRSVSEVLDSGMTAGRPVVPSPMLQACPPAPSPRRQPTQPSELAFDHAARELLNKRGKEAKEKYPELDEVPPEPGS